MKKIVFGLLAMCGLAMSPAVAQADFCCPQDCCDSSGYNGLYVGGNLGVLTNTFHRNDYNGFLNATNTPSGFSFNRTAFTAGVQLGYDVQCDSKVFGFVADWNWIDLQNRNSRFDSDITGDDIYVRDRNKWFTTLRGRAGLVVCDTLLYVTGGAAVTDLKSRWHNITHTDTDFTYRKSRWGWVGGVGAEFKVWCDFSVAAEFLYVNFDEHRRSFLDGTVPRVFGNSDTLYVGRVNVNYHFDLSRLGLGNWF